MMARSHWQHLAIIVLLWTGVSLVTRGDSCDSQTPATVVATADPTTPLDQLSGVVVIVSLVDEAGRPVSGAQTTLSWNSDNDKIAGTTSTGTSDDKGQVTFQGFGDADYGTWNLTVEGNYTQSVSRFRKSGNPNRITHVVKVLPSPSPTPSMSPSASPSPEPSDSPTPTPVPTVTVTATPFFSSGGGGGGGGTVVATPVPGSGPVSTQVIITAGSPIDSYPNATLP
jgi:hypothetical protein